MASVFRVLELSLVVVSHASFPRQMQDCECSYQGEALYTLTFILAHFSHFFTPNATLDDFSVKKGENKVSQKKCLL